MFLHPSKTYKDENGEEKPIPERFFRKEERVPYPVLDIDGKPVGGKDKFQWQGFDIFTTLTTTPHISYELNEEYYKRDEAGNVIGEYTFLAGRKELIVNHDIQLGSGGMNTLESSRAKAIMDEQLDQKAMLKQIMEFINKGANVPEVKAESVPEVKVESVPEVKAEVVAESDESLYQKFLAWKKTLILALCFGIAAVSFSSCKLEQSIGTTGCKIQEFATTNVSTDSTGIIVICDNSILVKHFPNLSAKILSRK